MAGEDLRILRERDFASLARNYVRYYEPVLQVLNRTSDRIYLQQYEQLVVHPAAAIGALEAFTGLNLRGFDAKADWPKVSDTFWAFSSPSDTPHYGRAVDPGRVRSYVESMSDDEAQVVLDVCAGVSARLARSDTRS